MTKDDKPTRTERHHERRAEAIRVALATGEGFLRIHEVAAVLGVTRQTVWDWASPKKGILPRPVRVGNVTGHPAAVIRDLINGVRKAA